MNKNERCQHTCNRSDFGSNTRISIDRSIDWLCPKIISSPTHWLIVHLFRNLGPHEFAPNAPIFDALHLVRVLANHKAVVVQLSVASAEGSSCRGSNGYIPPYIIMPRLHRNWISCLCRQLIISTDWRLMYTTHRKEAREIMTPTYIHYQVQSSNLESKLIHLCQNILEQGTNCNRRRVLRRFLGVNNQSRSQWVSLYLQCCIWEFWCTAYYSSLLSLWTYLWRERWIAIQFPQYGPNNCALRFMYCMILQFFKWMFAFISNLFCIESRYILCIPLNGSVISRKSWIWAGYFSISTASSTV
jgi:hypothetical protein